MLVSALRRPYQPVAAHLIPVRRTEHWMTVIEVPW
jgi:hypothetical protein